MYANFMCITKGELAGSNLMRIWALWWTLIERSTNLREGVEFWVCKGFFNFWLPLQLH